MRSRTIPGDGEDVFSTRRCKLVDLEGKIESADGLFAALSASSGSGTDVRGWGSRWAWGPGERAPPAQTSARVGCSFGREICLYRCRLPGVIEPSGTRSEHRSRDTPLKGLM